MTAWFYLKFSVVEVVVGEEPRPVEDVEGEEEDGHDDAANLLQLLVTRLLNFFHFITDRLSE